MIYNKFAESSTKEAKLLKAEAQLKKRALECRKIRLWLAAHPGSTKRQIQEGTGIKSQTPLFKMLGMGIIRFDGMQALWYVVPQ